MALFRLAFMLALLAITKGKCPNIDGLVECLTNNGIKNFTIFRTASAANFDHFWMSSIQNLRFINAASVKRPQAIIYPVSSEDIRRSVICCRRENWLIRVRSGGHSYEGLSSTADSDFVLIDLIHLNRIQFNDKDNTAWVQTGVTLGELYVAISNWNHRFTFPAGACPTVGVGGHFSGGGYGFISRKFGLAADKIIDARLITADGRILNRISMGDDVFWALRGGGGGSLGVVSAWKIQLVPVPPIVTLCNSVRLGMRLVSDLVYRWQTIAPNLPDNFYLNAIIASSTEEAERRKIEATFTGLFLDRLEPSVKVIEAEFPELRIRLPECAEMTYVEALLKFNRLEGLQELVARPSLKEKFSYKGKSDYIRTPLPLEALQGLWSSLQEEPRAYLILEPYGGQMAEIPSGAIAFPHRRGNLYLAQYEVSWIGQDPVDEAKVTQWSRDIYKYMTPYVTQPHQRHAYANYIDLDLGTAPNGTIGVEACRRLWGEAYFGSNFDRLVIAKTQIDPANVFRHPQSIPVSTRVAYVHDVSIGGKYVHSTSLN